jgi:hypothetical protein
MIDRLEDLDVDVKETGCGMDSTGSEYGPMAVPFEHGDKFSWSLKSELFLLYLRDCQVLKDYSPQVHSDRSVFNLLSFYDKVFIFCETERSSFIAHMKF